MGHLETVKRHSEISFYDGQEWGIKKIPIFERSTMLQGGSDSYIVLVILSAIINDPLTFTDIKIAIKAIDQYVEDFVRVDYCYRDWSPTGQHFTNDIIRIDRFLNGNEIISTYKHYVSIDC